jgi:hypothetical protein
VSGSRSLALFVPALFLLLVSAHGCSTNGGGDARVPDAGNKMSWQLVHQDLPAALTSVSGTSARNVYAVGAHDRDGSLILHFDGERERWRRIPTESQADLWWVLVLDEYTVFAAGTEGTILKLDSERERFEPMQTPGGATVFGLWGARQNDLWAVGGEPDQSPGFVWRFDGETWRDVTSELPAGEDGPVLFKVWGQHEDDVFLVGMDGASVHWDGERLAEVDTGQDRRLFTVHGLQNSSTNTSAARDEPRFVAVGGFGSGVILEHDGTRWHDVTPSEDPELGATPQLFGVHVRKLAGEVVGYAVGFDGAMLRRDATGWHRIEAPVELFLSFHGAFIDPEGGVWAVGGDVVTDALDQGMLLHHGKHIPSTIDE